MRSTASFIVRQGLLVGLAAFAYFWVRGLTESGIAAANRHAEQVLDLERIVGLDLELGLQRVVRSNDLLVDLANWVYIWAHWPLVGGTLVYLAVVRRRDFFELRNAMFISGAIGLVIFARYAVTPPRLFAPEYVDTVTERSISYRVLQPPGLVNKYAAVPSLHFGWNLLVGMSWRKASPGRLPAVAGIVMPVAMGVAVVATANHWTLDVVAGAAVALCGLGLERARQRYVGSMPARLWPEVPLRSLHSPDRDTPRSNLDEPLGGRGERARQLSQGPEHRSHHRSSGRAESQADFGWGLSAIKPGGERSRPGSWSGS